MGQPCKESEGLHLQAAVGKSSIFFPTSDKWTRAPFKRLSKLGSTCLGTHLYAKAAKKNLKVMNT